MNEYYFTVGQKYRNECHPLFIHPDGYLVIIADDHEAARKKMFELCGDKFATSYDKKSFDPSYYPAGELRRINSTETLESIFRLPLPSGANHEL